MAAIPKNTLESYNVYKIKKIKKRLFVNVFVSKLTLPFPQIYKSSQAATNIFMINYYYWVFDRLDKRSWQIVMS